MPDNDLEAEINTLALKIEEQIAETEARLESYPEFKPRSSRSRKMRNKMV